MVWGMRTIHPRPLIGCPMSMFDKWHDRGMVARRVVGGSKAMMFPLSRQWWNRRQEMRRLWRADALALIQSDERNAYYAAQRLAARSRALGDRQGFYHWAKVAAEVARRSSVAEMDLAVVEAVAAEELSRRR